ncbi:MAG: hypothetical protein ACRCXZ_02805 [Patescibacteria group bacterium]
MINGSYNQGGSTPQVTVKRLTGTLDECMSILEFYANSRDLNLLNFSVFGELDGQHTIVYCVYNSESYATKPSR